MAGQCLAWHTRAKAPGKPQSALFTTRYGNPVGLSGKRVCGPLRGPPPRGDGPLNCQILAAPWVAAPPRAATQQALTENVISLSHCLTSGRNRSLYIDYRPRRSFLINFPMPRLATSFRFEK